MTGDLPLHKCHKVVAAAKIIGICELGPDSFQLDLEGADAVTVSRGWLVRKVGEGNTPIGGYYVVYPQEPGELNAYSSWSPAYAFEAGYQRLPKRLPEPPYNQLRQGSYADLENRFRYHPPRNDDDRLRHTVVSEETLRLAKLLADICPEGRMLAQAFSALELVRMHANQAIACNHDALPA